MKTAFILSLIGSSLAAPTKTIENRQLGGSGIIDGPGALSSLLSGISGSSSGFSGLGSSGLGSGFSLPSGIPSLGGLVGAKRQTMGSSTENGVSQNSGCKELTLIFARGTGELGNMGTVVGPPLASKLASLTNNKVTIQGVNYDASVAVSISTFTSKLEFLI